MKNATKLKIKKMIPNIRFIRKAMRRSKLKRLRGKLLPEAEVAAGESSQEAKREIVARYSEKLSGYTKELKDELERYFDHKPALRERDDLESLRIDVLFNAFAYGFEPDEYFYYQVENKTSEEKREYITDLEHFIFAFSLNDIVDIEILNDKYRTYEAFKPYFKRDGVSIETQKDFAGFCAFIEKHPVFVRKSVSAARGLGVSKIDSRGQDPEELFASMIAEGKQLLEELVVQSDEMMRYNSSSVNTVRCPTLRTARGLEIGPCFFRAGQGGSFVDNAGSGGILASVDPNTGVLYTNGWDEFCNEYIVHPQSGVTIKGFQLPDWDLLRKTVMEMAALRPSLGYISWDMAHTNQGWVLIEANSAGQFVTQISDQRGIKRDLLEQMKGVFSFE